MILDTVKDGKENFIQGGTTTMGFCNTGKRLSLTLTSSRAKWGFIAKEQDGCQ